jgi:hypothetical protein
MRARATTSRLAGKSLPHTGVSRIVRFDQQGLSAFLRIVLVYGKRRRAPVLLTHASLHFPIHQNRRRFETRILNGRLGAQRREPGDESERER